MSDQHFRLGTLAVAFVLIASITYLRFCGSVSLPAKPPPPTGPRGTQSQLLSSSTISPEVYKGFLESDAASAGVPAPSVDQMSRKFAYRVDEARHVLEPGQPPVEAAGLRLHVERTADQLILAMDNLLGSAVAYEVVTEANNCRPGKPLPFNALVIPKGGRERRTECAWHAGMSIVVTKVETIEVVPLSAWYLSQLPPSLVGIEDRIARGHRGVQATEKCSPVMSQVVRSGMDRGEIGWRDLVDFYSRHRCQTYQFPSSYRALKYDHERVMPAAGG